MKISTLAALMKGDFKNAIISDTPGGIEAQEAAGQRSFVGADTFPIDMRGDRRVFEGMGLVFGEPVDDIFLSVIFPPGWKKVRTDHSMWSDLVDERGRKRASIFYKAAFYDRSAHAFPQRRYRQGRTHDDICFAYAKDEATDTMLWRSELSFPKPGYEDRDAYLFWSNQVDSLEAQARQWLDENYPDWGNPLAYWD